MVRAISGVVNAVGLASAVDAATSTVKPMMCVFQREVGHQMKRRVYCIAIVLYDSDACPFTDLF